MPVYIRKSPAAIPTPSEKECNEDEEDYYLRDPDQFQDHLPQPYRMINKMINLVFDNAWELIAAREELRRVEKLKAKATLHGPTSEIKLQDRANCVIASQDGRYIFVGLPRGIAAFSAPACSLVCTWEAENVEITAVHLAQGGKQVYLLATVDDMGVARLFTFSQDCFLLVKVVNEPEDVSKRNNCTMFELSNGGDFAGTLLEGSGESWLELYRLPKDSWPREQDQVPVTTLRQTPPSQTSGAAQPSSAGEGKPILPILIMKIKPPKTLSGSQFRSPSEALQKTDEGSVIGSGQNHVISTHQWEQQGVLFEHLFKKNLQMGTRGKEEKPSQAMFHFLLPGRILPMGLENPAQTAVPNAVSVWWSGSHNLFQYLLVRPSKDKPDTDPKPDVVWPCACSIVCSAISSCTSFLALGFADGTLTVWDRYLGLPLSVLTPLEDSEISNIQFLESPVDYRELKLVSGIPKHPKPQVLVLCRNGALYLVTASRGSETATVRLTEGSKQAECMISVAAPVPFLPSLVLMVSRNSMISLLDSAEGVEVCQLSLPPTHMLATPWDPVFAMDPENQSVLLRADRKPGAEAAAEGKDYHNSLFVFSFGSNSFLEELRQREKKASTPVHLAPCERRCEIYLQARLQSHSARKKQMTDCWQELRRHAATVKQ